MADIWDIESGENLEKLIANYTNNQTRENYLEVIQGAKRAAKERAIRGEFVDAEQVIRKVWSLPQVDPSQNYLQIILEGLDMDFFWEAVETGLAQSSSENLEALSQILCRMTPSILPKILEVLKRIRQPEFLYKVAGTIGAKDITPLLQSLESNDEATAYHGHIILKKLKSPQFFEKLSELKKHPSPKVRKLVVGILRGYATPSARVEMMDFLKDEAPVRKAALEDPKNLAERMNFDGILEVIREKIGQWSDDEIQKLFQALALSDPEKIQSWVNDTFSKKTGFFSKKVLEKEKNLFVTSLVDLDDQPIYELAGRMVREEGYNISPECRQRLISFREKAKIDKAKKTGQFSRDQIRDLLKVHKKGDMSAVHSDFSPIEEPTEEGAPQKDPNRISSKMSKDEILSVLAKPSSVPTSPSPEEEPTEEGPPPKDPNRISSKMSKDEILSVLAKPSSPPTPPPYEELEKPSIAKKKQPPKVSPLSSPSSSQISPPPTSLSGLSEVLENELAHAKTEDVTEDVMAIRAELEQKKNSPSVEDDLISASLNETAASIVEETVDIPTKRYKMEELEEKAVLEAQSSEPPLTPEVAKEPDLLIQLAKALYGLDLGKFLNLLREFFIHPHKEGSKMDEQRTQLVLFLCAKSDKSVLMFLDYLRTEEKIHLSDKLKKITEITLKREGLLF